MKKAKAKEVTVSPRAITAINYNSSIKDSAQYLSS